MELDRAELVAKAARERALLRYENSKRPARRFAVGDRVRATSCGVAIRGVLTLYDVHPWHCGANVQFWRDGRLVTWGLGGESFDSLEHDEAA